MYSCSVILSVLAITLLICFAQGQYEDVRCKCVCPSNAAPHHNSSTPTRKIFVKSFHEPSMCKCEHVIDKSLQVNQFCNKCQCQWQRRNTATIKVVVVFIVCVVSLLVLYMLFLLCLDPLMSRRPRSQYEQHHEEVNLDTQSIQYRTAVDETVRSRPGVISRVKDEMRRVHGEQERWKGTVQEQRRHIYDSHTMLN